MSSSLRSRISPRSEALAFRRWHGVPATIACFSRTSSRARAARYPWTFSCGLRMFSTLQTSRRMPSSAHGRLASSGGTGPKALRIARGSPRRGGQGKSEAAKAHRVSQRYSKDRTNGGGEEPSTTRGCYSSSREVPATLALLEKIPPYYPNIIPLPGSPTKTTGVPNKESRLCLPGLQLNSLQNKQKVRLAAARRPTTATTGAPNKTTG